jgi:hypothetical protein
LPICCSFANSFFFFFLPIFHIKIKILLPYTKDKPFSLKIVYPPTFSLRAEQFFFSILLNSLNP